MSRSRVRGSIRRRKTRTRHSPSDNRTEPARRASRAKAETSSRRPVFETAETPEPCPPSTFPAISHQAAGEPPRVCKAAPVPDEGLQGKIAAQLAGVYNPSPRREPAEKIKLAYQLLQAAKASKEPNERYVLLRQGASLPVKGAICPGASSH